MRKRKFNWNHSKACKDHNGKKYKSLTSMANAYGLTQSCLSRRLKVYQWSLEKALTTPPKKTGGVTCYDHLGKRYRSESYMCKQYGIERKTYQYRINKGWSVEDALITPPLKKRGE